MKKSRDELENVKSFVDSTYSRWGNFLALDIDKPYDPENSALGYCYKYIDHKSGKIVYKICCSKLGIPDTDFRIMMHEYGHIYLAHMDSIHEEMDVQICNYIRDNRGELIDHINKSCGIDFADKLIERVIDDPALNHSIHNIAMDMEVNSTVLSKEDIEEMEMDITSVMPKTDEQILQYMIEHEVSEDKRKEYKDALDKMSKEAKVKLILPCRYNMGKDANDNLIPFPDDLTYSEYVILIFKFFDQFIKMLVSIDKGGNGDTSQVSQQDIQNALNNWLNGKSQDYLDGYRKALEDLKNGQAQSQQGQGQGQQQNQGIDPDYAQGFQDGYNQGMSQQNQNQGQSQQGQGQQNQSQGSQGQDTGDQQQNGGQPQQGNGQGQSASGGSQAQGQGQGQGQSSSQYNQGFQDGMSSAMNQNQGQSQQGQGQQQSSGQGKSDFQQGYEDALRDAANGCANGQGQGQGGMDGLSNLMGRCGMMQPNNKKGQAKGQGQEQVDGGSSPHNGQKSRADSGDSDLKKDHGNASRDEADKKRKVGQIKAGGGVGCGKDGNPDNLRDVDPMVDDVDMALKEVMRNVRHKVIKHKDVKDIMKLYNRGIQRKVIVPSISQKIELSVDPKLVFLIDISGSMNTELVDRVLKTIAKSLYKLNRSLRYDIITWSTRLGEHIKDIDPKKRIPRISCGGGTDMASGMVYFKNNYDKNAILILISDFEDSLNEWHKVESSMPGYLMYGFNYGYHSYTQEWRYFKQKNFSNYGYD